MRSTPDGARATAFPIPDEFRMAGVPAPHHPPSRAARLRGRLALATAALAFLAVLGASSEDLDTGRACATLCPGTDLQSREVTLSAISEEHVVPGFLENGGEALLALIDRKDTVQTRAAVRFDTLITQYTDSVTDSLKTIDSLAQASLLLTVDRRRSTIQDSVVLEIFDVDDGSDDTTTTGIESRLTEARRIGTRRLGKGDFDSALGDTVQVALDPNRILAILRRSTEATRRLRIAIKASSPRSLVLRLDATTAGSAGPVLRYRHPRAKSLTTMVAHSDTPANTTVAAELADFTTIPVQPPRPSGSVIAVGGLPAKRTVLRFSIPDSIDKAAAIIQAELRLVQLPDPLRALVDTVVNDTSVGPKARLDTVVVAPLIGIGSAVVTADPVRAGQLARRALATDAFSLPALRVAPSDSGVRTIDVAGLIRRWSTQPAGDPRYIVLATDPLTGSEGAQSASAYFFSTAATNPDLRPVLYIRYIPRVGYGIP